VELDGGGDLYEGEHFRAAFHLQMFEPFIEAIRVIKKRGTMTKVIFIIANSSEIKYA